MKRYKKAAIEMKFSVDCEQEDGHEDFFSITEQRSSQRELAMATKK